ncbi:MAG TPA: DUF2490 domain-containing protein [Pyrinomonadaceae bacterium]|nr:DUF2490 domain-containing protein [Pyrinomonadaceae bacterium]
MRSLLLLLLLVTGASAQSPVDHTDNQQWNDVQLAVPVTKNFDFNILGTLRFGRDISHPVDERVGAGLTWKIGKYWTVSPNYQHIGMQPVRGRKVWENRLSLPVTLRFNADKFRLSDRNLIERRLRNSGAKSTRYRNRFQVEHPIGEKEWNLSLYAADEVFYDWSVDRWVRNRITVGAIKVFNKHYTQDFYYLRQNDGVSMPGDLNVIGTSLRFRL